jgi:2-hydroxychromene-2-carboxylate isomerase
MSLLSVKTEPSKIEFWFEFGSNYSYLSVMRIEDAARQKAVPIIWRPFLLGPIFRALGMENSPFVLQKEKGTYVGGTCSASAASMGCDGGNPVHFHGSGFFPCE